jgi:hypothetical protein
MRQLSVKVLKAQVDAQLMRVLFKDVARGLEFCRRSGGDELDVVRVQFKTKSNKG